MLSYILFDLYVFLLLEKPNDSNGALELRAFPASTVEIGKPLTLRCSFINSAEGVATTEATTGCYFFWSHSPPPGDAQRIFRSSTPGMTISTDNRVTSILTIQRVDESKIGIYMCHMICNDRGSSVRVIRVEFREAGHNAEESTTVTSTGNNVKLITHGGLIAFAALTCFLVITGLCALTVSKKRLCCCSCCSHSHEDGGNINISANHMRSRAYTDDPPAYDSVVSQAAHFISGKTRGVCERTASFPWRRGLTRDGRRHGRNCSHQNGIQGISTDTQNNPSFIHVDCERVSSPLEKPPDYWTWIKDHHIKDMYALEIPPPLYGGVSNKPAETVLAGATGIDSRPTDVTVHTLSQTGSETIRPVSAQHLSENNCTNL